MYDLIDYKGKFDIIQDKTLLDDEWDVVVGEISHAKVLEQLEARVEFAIYYGVPAYVGDNKEINDLIIKYVREYKQQ
jgi:hypothetical protein